MRCGFFVSMLMQKNIQDVAIYKFYVKNAVHFLKKRLYICICRKNVVPLPPKYEKHTKNLII